MQSFVLSSNVKPEFPVEKPTIFGYVDAEDSEPVNFWINKGSMDGLHSIMPKSWHLMIKADRVNWRQYCWQKDISGLIDETLEKTCTSGFSGG